jgi:ABC-2 type transport system ATP-binding protein
MNSSAASGATLVGAATRRPSRPGSAASQDPLFSTVEPRHALSVESLAKSYGAREAVKGVSFGVDAGEIYGLLGPNGAGKTSILSILATARRPSGGDARILGASVVKDPAGVRRAIGLVPQDISLYPGLTAEENLRFFGQAYGLSGRELNARIEELLFEVGLEARGREPVVGFSGGMKRRLNLAVGVIHRPQVVLVDEPTVGVDPQSRERIFDIVRRLRDAGAALLYTTHYLEEAERLCDRIGIIDDGAIIASGTLSELIGSAAAEGEVIEVEGLGADFDPGQLRAARGVQKIEHGDGAVRLFVSRAVDVLAPLGAALEKMPGARVFIRTERLEDYFLRLTGRRLRD